IAWGSTYLAIRFAVATMPPFLMAGVRFLVAGSILFIWRYSRGDARPSRLEWRSAAIVGFFLLVCGNGGVVWAEQRVVSGIAALMVGSSPLWMVLFDLFRPAKNKTHVRPGWMTIAGVIFGFTGIIVLVGPSSLTGITGSVDPVGAAVLTLSAFFWAIGSLYNRSAKLPASPFLGTGMEMLAGGAGLLVLGTLLGEWGMVKLSAISLSSFLGLIYLIVFGSLIGYASYTWLLRVAPTPLVSTYAYVNPVVAIFMGNLLAHEPLTPRILLAAAIILSAVALITATQPAAHKAEKMSATAPAAGDD
ncbi:MAG: EamA family transporter, partial [Omnitrophica WOR_2 bacterium]